MKREPLLSGDVIPVKLRSPEEVDAMHEKARAKDAELIQRLVDTLQHVADAGTWSPDISEAIAAADAHGFKPSQQ